MNKNEFYHHLRKREIRIRHRTEYLSPDHIREKVYELDLPVEPEVVEGVFTQDFRRLSLEEIADRPRGVDWRKDSDFVILYNIDKGKWDAITFDDIIEVFPDG